MSSWNTYTDAFLEANTRTNLSAARTPEAVRKQIEDSLSLAEAIPLSNTTTLLDVGSGGGFPGLVLAAAFPQLQVTLLDARQKKCTALEQLATTLGLKNVRVVCGRAETLARESSLRESFELVVAKAVAALPTLLELTVPFAKEGGTVVAYKSAQYQEELEQAKRAQHILGVELAEVHRYTLEQEDEARALLLFTKKEPLSHDYPRRDGLPKKDPL